MLVDEYQLTVPPAHRAALEGTIRVVQCSRTSCLRVRRDERGSGATALPLACRRLAQEGPLLAPRHSPVRQAAATRAWQTIRRFSAACRAPHPGKQGSLPHFQHDGRSVEDQATGWQVDAEGTP